MGASTEKIPWDTEQGGVVKDPEVAPCRRSRCSVQEMLGSRAGGESGKGPIVADL